MFTLIMSQGSFQTRSQHRTLKAARKDAARVDRVCVRAARKHGCGCGGHTRPHTCGGSDWHAEGMILDNADGSLVERV